jgi:hypothetical protein
MNKIDENEYYIHLPGNRALIVGPDEDGLSLSLHFPGGHIMVSTDNGKAFEVLEAIQAILTPKGD